MKQRSPIGLRFARQVQASPGKCWVWTGAKNEHGYGVLGRGGRGEGVAKAHRVSYQIFYGVVLTSTQCVLHRCDNPNCVNPEHLFLGTQQDNLIDMRRKRRDSPPPSHVGVHNKTAKLNDDKVKQVFDLRRAGLTSYQIAERLGVSRPAICSILNRKTWRHVDVANHIR